ncbi:hypothetical protein QX201_000787 [Fusarium graminearum]
MAWGGSSSSEEKMGSSTTWEDETTPTTPGEGGEGRVVMASTTSCRGDTALGAGSRTGGVSLPGVAVAAAASLVEEAGFFGVVS